jgi:pimeloyl-ACP methyl ester carboxylesterase
MKMASTYFWTTDDGIRIAVHELGAGRPLLLLHGYFSNAKTNWITYGTAQALAEAGFRCIMPDLRAHGESDKPHDPSHYPPDVLASDQHSLIEHLGLTDYDLAGYSLGARTVARMLAMGAVPRKAILSGMGLAGLTATGQRGSHFRNILRNLGNHPKGSPEWMAEAFLKTSKGDPIALDRILDTFVDTPIEMLKGYNLPIGVICGADDADNGSATDLANALAQGEYLEIPGNHMSAVTKPELGAAMVRFLTA